MEDAEAEGEPTSESASVGGSKLPAASVVLRDQLPGLESERRVTDWGRSERVQGAADRLLLDFLYHYWFRAEVEGIENVPHQGGTLLMANHAGVLPSDAMMIAKALQEEHPYPRPVHLSVSPTLPGIPGLGMVVTKLGGVADHPANLSRLLLDEQEQVLCFPEGAAAARKPTRRRYLVGSLCTEPLQIAAQAQAQIVPVALLGAEESSPLFTRLGAIGPTILRKRLPALPLTLPVPLPAKFRIRFLEPVLPRPAEARARPAQELAQEIQALIQENLLEMVGERRSVWLG